jgi:hypothetical protein
MRALRIATIAAAIPAIASAQDSARAQSREPRQ